MSSLRLLMSVLVSAAMLAACAAESEPPAAMATAEVNPVTAANPVTGEGLPNPNPTRIGSWATLPEGREWGSTAGLDIDPTDGHVWGYERCGSGSAGGPGVNCDNNPVDPIFKFDRNTGEILANFGAGTFVTPHGIYADGEGNVWVTDFAGNDEGTKGHQVHKFSPTGELLMSLGIAGQPGNGPDHLNQPIDVIVAPDGSIFVADGHAGQNLTTDEQMAEARAAGLTGRIVKYSPDGEYIMSGVRSARITVSSARHTPWSSTLRAGSGSRTVATTASRSSTKRVTTWTRAISTGASATSSSPRTRWCTPSTPSPTGSGTSTGGTASASDLNRTGNVGERMT